MTQLYNNSHFTKNLLSITRVSHGKALRSETLFYLPRVNYPYEKKISEDNLLTD